ELEAFDRLFSLFDKFIPRSARSRVQPVVAGGCLGSVRDDSDKQVNKSIRACRNQVVKRLRAGGFAEPRIRCGKSDELHSLFLDLEKCVIRLEIMDVIEGEVRSSEPFRCE